MILKERTENCMEETSDFSPCSSSVSLLQMERKKKISVKLYKNSNLGQLNLST